MKLRTLEELSQSLDDEFAWRIQELYAIRTEVNSANDSLKRSKLRAGVALLYAHWEGFFRQASILYLDFIVTRRLRLDELCPGLLTIALRRRLTHFHAASDIQKSIQLVETFQHGLHERANLNSANAVDVGGNLNSLRLKTLLLTLGLDYSPYELKEKLLDSQLLHFRNNIAHGKHLCPDHKDFEHMFTEVVALLRCFKNQIENGAATKAYSLS